MGKDKKQFVKEVPSLIICSKCNDVLDGCVEGNGKKLCEQCAINSGIKEYIKNEKMNQIIQNLQVYCKNRRLNCTWIGKLSLLQTHLITCSFKPLSCPNPSCTFFGTKELLDIHSKTCLYRTCESCNRLLKDSNLTQKFNELTKENQQLKQKIELLTKEMTVYKFENDKLMEITELQDLRIKDQQDELETLETTFQDKISNLLHGNLTSLGEFMNDNFDILREQFVEDNIRLNKEIKEIKEKNQELIFELFKLKEANEEIELLREKVIELEKQNLNLKTNENYKELSKKLITKCDLLTEQNHLLAEELKFTHQKEKTEKDLEKIEEKLEILKPFENIDISKGVISDFYNGIIKSNPIVQVMNKFQKYVSNGKEKYRIWISDGINSYPAITGSLPSQMISEGLLTPFSVVRITECVKDTKNEVLLITGMEIINNKCNQVIGNPIRIDSKLYVWRITKDELINLKFSSVFIIRGYNWKLQLCCSKKSIGFLLFPVNMKPNSEYKTEFNFMIMHPSTQNHYKGPGTKWNNFTSIDKGSGWSNFIKREELEEYFKEDAISVCISITQIEEVTKNETTN